MIRIAAIAVFAGFSWVAAAQQVEIYDHRDDPMLRLGTYTFPGGKTVAYSVGIGSGAFRAPGDPPSIFWAVSDRGPNWVPGESKKIAGVEGEKLCGGLRGCRIYGWPDYPPSIYRFEVRDDGSFRVLDAISLKTSSGLPVTGRLNPLTVAANESGVGPDGKPIAHDPNAVDAEGIVRLSDGTFWIGDENGPSIMHVAADGRILRRLVPDGTQKDYAGADMRVDGALPAILARRATNRGIESMAVSGDERHLYFILQNPLANPDVAAYRNAANARIVRVDRQTLRPTAQWVYAMAPTSEYKGDEGKPQNEVRISELTWIGENRFLVDERTEKTTKIFEIDVSQATDILGSKWDDPATVPSLEQSRTVDIGIVPVRKTLRFDTAGRPDLPTKIEGVALFGDGSLMLINDDDFGIDGARTRVVRVRGLTFGR